MRRRRARRPCGPVLLAGALALLAACAGPRPRVDALEPINRTAVTLEQYGPAPFARGVGWALDRGVPEPARDAIGRFLQNLAAPRNVVAQLAQARPDAAADELARFLANTTLGLLGFRDAATGLGLPRRDEDMGQAFCRWGIPFGPYVYFPILGPSSASEAVSVTLDLALAPADLLLGPLATQAARRTQLQAIARAWDESTGTDFYTFPRVAYRKDRLRQARDAPAFVPPTPEELRDPQPYGTCGYSRPGVTTP